MPCLKNVIPKYANLKFTNNSPVSQVITKKAQVIRIKNEIKFLFKKKEKPQYNNKRNKVLLCLTDTSLYIYNL